MIGEGGKRGMQWAAYPQCCLSLMFVVFCFWHIVLLSFVIGNCLKQFCENIQYYVNQALPQVAGQICILSYKPADPPSNLKNLQEREEARFISIYVYYAIICYSNLMHCSKIQCNIKKYKSAL